MATTATAAIMVRLKRTLRPSAASGPDTSKPKKLTNSFSPEGDGGAVPVNKKSWMNGLMDKLMNGWNKGYNYIDR